MFWGFIRFAISSSEMQHNHSISSKVKYYKLLKFADGKYSETFDEKSPDCVFQWQEIDERGEKLPPFKSLQKRNIRDIQNGVCEQKYVPSFNEYCLLSSDEPLAMNLNNDSYFPKALNNQEHSPLNFEPGSLNITTQCEEEVPWSDFMEFLTNSNFLHGLNSTTDSDLSNQNFFIYNSTPIPLVTDAKEQSFRLLSENEDQSIQEFQKPDHSQKTYMNTESVFSESFLHNDVIRQSVSVESLSQGNHTYTFDTPRNLGDLSSLSGKTDQMWNGIELGNSESHTLFTNMHDETELEYSLSSSDLFLDDSTQNFTFDGYMDDLHTNARTYEDILDRSLAFTDDLHNFSYLVSSEPHIFEDSSKSRQIQKNCHVTNNDSAEKRGFLKNLKVSQKPQALRKIRKKRKQNPESSQKNLQGEIQKSKLCFQRPRNVCLNAKVLSGSQKLKLVLQKDIENRVLNPFTLDNKPAESKSKSKESPPQVRLSNAPGNTISVTKRSFLGVNVTQIFYTFDTSNLPNNSADMFFKLTFEDPFVFPESHRLVLFLDRRGADVSKFFKSKIMDILEFDTFLADTLKLFSIKNFFNSVDSIHFKSNGIFEMVRKSGIPVNKIRDILELEFRPYSFHSKRNKNFLESQNNPFYLVKIKTLHPTSYENPLEDFIDEINLIVNRLKYNAPFSEMCEIFIDAVRVCSRFYNILSPMGMKKILLSAESICRGVNCKLNKKILHIFYRIGQFKKHPYTCVVYLGSANNSNIKLMNRVFTHCFLDALLSHGELHGVFNHPSLHKNMIKILGSLIKMTLMANLSTSLRSMHLFKDAVIKQEIRALILEEMKLIK